MKPKKVIYWAGPLTDDVFIYWIIRRKNGYSSVAENIKTSIQDYKFDPLYQGGWIQWSIPKKLLPSSEN